ncbi:extracellular solute-binding protein [Acidisphaera sp. L21]|jgi:putative spermidine/putrescine transport system substrate-binding protein|uniref:extracellular solute-binding protein n=1 Tax=Acidisphaera sp. L21 TaxID=1641851 RepID=UPI00131A7FA2|nr:extracellular solute-binding protein [Acidisphaera sp. L21]
MPLPYPNRRLVLGGLAAASLAPRAQAQSSDSFVVATYGGLFEQILRKNVIPDFEAKHGVRVVLELGQGTTFLPKLATARRRSPYDVVYVNDDEAALGGSMGLWAPDMSAQIPNVAALYPSLRPSKAMPLYTTTVYDFPLLYRTALAAPTSWGDLWSIDQAVGVPHISNSYGLTFLLIAALLNGGDAANMAPGFAAVKRLKNPKVWRGITQGYGMFQQGEVVAGLMYNHRAQQLVDAGLPVAMVHPKEGVWGQRTGLQIPKTATRPDLSAAWADIALGVDYQAAFAEGLYSPSNAKVPLKQAEKFVTGEARINGLRFPDWDVINPQRDALLDQWNRVVGN